MEPRFNHFKAAPDTYKALSGLETYLHGGGRRVSSKPMLVLAFLITSTLIIISPLMAQETITPLMSHALAEVSGKEVLMYTVGFPPGFSSPVHRPPQCAGVSLRAGGLRRDAGERRKRNHAEARPELL